MLSDLKIENVAVIEKAGIGFEKGLNIMTGETGAGKSIVIDAINAVLGERTSKDIVRTGTSAAKITAYFENISDAAVRVLGELEIECEPDRSLLINRTVTADGRSTCRVNGQTLTVSMLRKLGRELITICGQHDSQHLLQKETHIEYIDFLADIGQLLSQYREAYREVVKKKKELNAFIRSLNDKEERREYLSYRIGEIEAAKIQIGEKARLTEEKKKLQNREKLMKALYGARVALDGEGEAAGCTQGLYALTGFLSQLGEYNGEFDGYARDIEKLSYLLSECSSLIGSEISSLEGEELDVNFIEERLDVLYRISKKYGETEEEILENLEKYKAELELIETSDDKRLELENEIYELSERLFDLAEEVSERRKKAAEGFEKDVMAELSYLDMPSAVFKVSFTQTAATSKGIDDVEFLISANSGQEPKPLSKIASGGELSRIMLAIKCVLSDLETADTMIFDEIDTGVSGRAAHKIAYKLRALGKKRQTICVTHLAQIAAAADNHLFIEKHNDGESTFTKIRKLIDDEHIYEIARIIGGEVITRATVMSACELIDFANTP
ncbi:MAG: DNA repair protein RecN [Ruminococcaceae bacterium]|nr:DNA repair protein RecN [Oscillospiraceae bacterium]